jgi:hypothetical protein
MIRRGHSTRCRRSGDNSSSNCARRPARSRQLSSPSPPPRTRCGERSRTSPPTGSSHAPGRSRESPTSGTPASGRESASDDPYPLYPPTRGSAYLWRGTKRVSLRRRHGSQNPAPFLSRTDLRELGLERRAVDAAFRALPVVALPGYSRPLIRVDDYLRLLEESTYSGDRVREADRARARYALHRESRLDPSAPYELTVARRFKNRRLGVQTLPRLSGRLRADMVRLKPSAVGEGGTRLSEYLTARRSYFLLPFPFPFPFPWPLPSSFADDVRTGAVSRSGMGRACRRGCSRVRRPHLRSP